MSNLKQKQKGKVKKYNHKKVAHFWSTLVYEDHDNIEGADRLPSLW